MRLQVAILVILLLLQCGLSDTPQTVVTFEPANKDLVLRRVEKRAEVTYTYNVVDDQRFHQFPDFAIEINLPYSQYVKIEYNIQNWTPEVTYFFTRVIIDGGEPFRELRVATGYINYHSH
jgi:hypothetical protein